MTCCAAVTLRQRLCILCESSNTHPGRYRASSRPVERQWRRYAKCARQKGWCSVKVLGTSLPASELHTSRRAALIKIITHTPHSRQYIVNCTRTRMLFCLTIFPVTMTEVTSGYFSICRQQPGHDCPFFPSDIGHAQITTLPRYDKPTQSQSEVPDVI